MKKSDEKLTGLFLEKLVAEDGLSKNTITSYQLDLKLLSTFLNSKNSDFLNADEEHLKLYLQKLYEEGILPSSASRKVSCFRNLFKFLEAEGHRKNNPAINIIKPKISRKLPKFLTEKEIFTLLDVVNKDDSDFGIRLSCMLEILYASGLRVSELVTLPINIIQKTVDEKGEPVFKNYMVIKGKGNKERIAPLNKPALENLKKYLDLRKRLGHENSRWLFCGHLRASKIIGKESVEVLPELDEPITRQRFHQMLKELAIKSGIDPKRVSPHAIRHSFASHLLNRGVDLRVLQELLGHSDISTTQIYTHILDSKLRDLVNNCHPLAKDFI